MVPDDLKYTAEHEWVRVGDDGVAQIGITDFAQSALGDVVFVSLPEVGTQVSAGQALGEVESTKSVSEVYAPFDGEVTGNNPDLESRPELLNSDPYAGGWIVSIRPTDESGTAALLDASSYQALIDGQS